jgi:hypothetical protein
MRDKVLFEDMTRSEIRNYIESEVDDMFKSREFEKRVREVTANVMEKFFRMMYNRRNFWKGEIKNG